MRNFLLILTVLVCLLTGAYPVHCETFQGKVVKVVDGDSITVLNNNKQYKIRLYGIDCPEDGQAYGNKAKKFTSSLTYGKTVEFTVYDVDKYRRLVAVVKANGRNINEAILKNGYAWRYTQYCKESFCNDWVAVEFQARQSKVGLWQDKSPIPPWEWRHSPKRQQQIVSNQVGRERQKNEYQRQQQVRASSGVLHGNASSHVYHNPSCKWYNCKNCYKTFSSAEEARRAGYRACKKCGG